VKEACQDLYFVSELINCNTTVCQVYIIKKTHTS